ncbi:hypothetical protein TNIN_156401 [Trichonephila inaurata madagascariensis]|uniref:Uncharacterized protein n=1 Tax=Trichonephila inaurata madagascariensis TaxID=2747483 RepID=A0A8X6YKF3_9ARAC|nr:hypothetical protein TNIN_156401 [Trichonephila inaurata madagascariensis]
MSRGLKFERATQTSSGPSSNSRPSYRKPQRKTKLTSRQDCGVQSNVSILHPHLRPYLPTSPHRLIPLAVDIDCVVNVYV